MAYTKSRADWADGGGGGTPITQLQLDTIEQGIFDAAATADAAVPKSVVDAAGDLIVGSGADAVTRLAVGSATQLLHGGSTPAWSAFAIGDIADGLITAAKLATVTKKVAVPTSFASAAFSTNLRWPDAASNFVTWVFHVPGDYVSGDITFKSLMRSGVTDANTVRLLLDAFRFRDGAAFNQFGTAIDKSLTGWTNGQDKLFSHVLAAANFLDGDQLYVQVTRDGAHVSDTHTGNLIDDGAWIEYTGRI